MPRMHTSFISDGNSSGGWGGERLCVSKCHTFPSIPKYGFLGSVFFVGYYFVYLRMPRFIFRPKTPHLNLLRDSTGAMTAAAAGRWSVGRRRIGSERRRSGRSRSGGSATSSVRAPGGVAVAEGGIGGKYSQTFSFGD